MAYDQIHQVGATGQFLEVVLRDSTGAPKTGLAATAVTASYIREGGAAVVAVPLSSTTLGIFVAGGWVEVDATNMPGTYQIGLPNAILAAGAKAATLMLKGTGFVTKAARVVLVGADFRDAASLGLSRIDAPISGVGAQVLSNSGNKLATDSFGRVTAQAVANAVTVGTNNDKTGYSLATAPPTVQAIVDGLLNTLLAGYSVVGSVGRKLRDWTLGASGKAVLESTERVTLASTQPDYAPAKPSDVAPTIAFNPTINPPAINFNPTINPAPVQGGYTPEARAELLGAIGTPQQTGEEVTLPEPPPPGYSGSGGGSGDGSYTDEDRTRDEATAARVAALGGKPVVYTDSVGRGGELTIRRGYARKRTHGNAIGPFTFTADLTDAEMQLRGIGPVAAFEPFKSFADGKWTVNFDLDDVDAAGLQIGAFAYIVAAVYPDGSELDPVERTSGVAKVV